MAEPVFDTKNNIEPDLDIRPLSGALGAEVRGLDLRNLDDAGFEAVQAFSCSIRFSPSTVKRT